MRDGIEVHFDAKRGHLSLACDAEAFSSIRVLVFEEALISEIVGLPSRNVSRIEIESVPVVAANRQRLHPWSTSLLVGGPTRDERTYRDDDPILSDLLPDLAARLSEFWAETDL